MLAHKFVPASWTETLSPAVKSQLTRAPPGAAQDTMVVGASFAGLATPRHCTDDASGPRDVFRRQGADLSSVGARVDEQRRRGGVCEEREDRDERELREDGHDLGRGWVGRGVRAERVLSAMRPIRRVCARFYERVGAAAPRTVR
jgi:hypothetical protein